MPNNIEQDNMIARADLFSFRPLRPPADAALLQHWFARDEATFWLMQDKSVDEVRHIYQQLMDSGHATAYLGLRGGQPAFLVECYSPCHDRIGRHYAVQPGDLGMHLFIGPPGAGGRVRGYSRVVFRAVLRFLFDDLDARRVVVEPDARNDKIHALNRQAGFVYGAQVQFTEKVAALAFCTRANFEQAMALSPTDNERENNP